MQSLYNSCDVLNTDSTISVMRARALGRAIDRARWALDRTVRRKRRARIEERNTRLSRQRERLQGAAA